MLCRVAAWVRGDRERGWRKEGEEKEVEGTQGEKAGLLLDSQFQCFACTAVLRDESSHLQQRALPVLVKYKYVEPFLCLLLWSEEFHFLSLPHAVKSLVAAAAQPIQGQFIAAFLQQKRRDFDGLDV